MGKIYVISAFGGQYADAWQSNLYAVRTQAEAEAAVFKEKEQHSRLHLIAGAVREVYYAYQNTAVKDIKEIPQSPKGPTRSSKESMADYRGAKENWQLITRPLVEHNDAENRRVYLEAKKVAKQKAVELGASVEDLEKLGFRYNGIFQYSYHDSDTSFEFEEIELK